MRSVHWLALAVVASLGLAPSAHADWRDRALRDYIRSRMSGRLAAAHVPSFSRQTGLACSACHYQFLTLTPLGRDFKLNGYTLTRQQLIVEKDKSKGKTLQLSPVPLVAAMLEGSLTHFRQALPDAQNGVTELPQQMSLFLAGELTSKIGLFSQLTYSGADGTFGIDNIDLRFADKKKLRGSTDIIYGVSLNNNPTVQDAWNTIPAWGFPFASPDVAPGTAAGTVIDGALAQQALGLGAYALLGGTVYAELSGYRSAMQGRALADSFAIDGVAPYWRLALQKNWEHQSVMVGTYGLRTNQFPGAVGAGIPTDHFTDIGLDAQAEAKAGTGSVVARGTWIHEKQDLEATFGAGGAANPKDVVRVLRLNSSYYPKVWLGVTLGYFQTTGTSDTLRYAPAPVSGSANGSPETKGFIGELDFNPWQNTRLGMQYTAYGRFNGGKGDYDGFGRRASDNDTLYLLAWVVF